MKTKEIVYQQGNNWIWSHNADSRGLCETEQLPYWVQTKKEVRQYIADRYNNRGKSPDFRICWA